MTMLGTVRKININVDYTPIGFPILYEDGELLRDLLVSVTGGKAIPVILAVEVEFKLYPFRTSHWKYVHKLIDKEVEVEYVWEEGELFRPELEYLQLTRNYLHNINKQSFTKEELERQRVFADILRREEKEEMNKVTKAIRTTVAKTKIYSPDEIVNLIKEAALKK